MSDEIKEILDNFEKYEARYKLHNETQFIITHREIEQLLDYITNLQQESDFYKHICLRYGRKGYEELYQEKEDYKSRCEKAIEYIKENQDMVEWIHIPGWELLNILDENNE